MWLFTRDGFYSVAATKFCKPGDVAVRARRKEHIERLMDRHGFEAEILCFAESDYKYRVQIPRELWSRILAHEAETLDYNSFKDALVEEHADSEYLRAMFTTWGVLRKMQVDELPPEG